MNRETTIYGQLMESIRNKIISGDLKIGDRLESERTMSEKYGINRMTVRKALKYLENEGVLESRRGSGTYVSKMPLVQGKLSMDDSNHTLSLSALIRQRGMKSTGCCFQCRECCRKGTLPWFILRKGRSTRSSGFH